MIMEETPRIVFFGTSDFSVSILEHLKETALLPTLIVTQPDKPKGRKMVITPPPVKVWAEAEGIPTIQPESLKETPPELQNDWDVFVVVAYGKIIPKHILDIPNRGALNIHPSLLPKLRGPSPIQSAILTDMKETGVTLMLLDEEMDHGPILAQAKVEIENLSDDKTSWPPKASVLEEIFAHIGGELLTENLIPWINGDITEEAQNDDEATFCEMIKKEDGEIDLNADPYQNYLKIQAFDQWPGTYFFVEKRGKRIRVKIMDAEFKDGTLTVTRVVPEGKNEMDYEDFRRGLRAS